MIELLKIRENENIAEQAANWFHQKWSIPLKAYQESICECLVTFHTLAKAADFVLSVAQHITPNEKYFVSSRCKKHYAAFRKTHCLLAFSCLFAA